MAWTKASRTFSRQPIQYRRPQVKGEPILSFTSGASGGSEELHASSLQPQADRSGISQVFQPMKEETTQPQLKEVW